MEMQLLHSSLGVKEGFRDNTDPLENGSRSFPVPGSADTFGNRLATQWAANDERRPATGNHNLPSRLATGKAPRYARIAGRPHMVAPRNAIPGCRYVRTVRTGL